MNMQMHSGMGDKDMVNTLLADEKRTAGEYATATLEANCQTVHQAFTKLLQGSLQTQRQVFDYMNQQGWYSSPSTAQAQDVQKQIQQASQTGQQLQQTVQSQGTSAQQMTGGQAGAMNTAVMDQVMHGSKDQTEQAKNNQRPM